MAPALQALMSGTVTVGVPLALAAWELYRMRRDRGGDGGPRRGPIPRTPRPLPDCLVPRLPPRPAPARPTPINAVRALERV